MSYTNTFILVAADCPVSIAEPPKSNAAAPSVPRIQFELLTATPYGFTFEELLVETHAKRNGLTAVETKRRAAAIREAIFAKPQPCLRASPLPKRYGWGVHHDAAGRIALYAVESPEYREFAGGDHQGVKVVNAMRSKR